MPYRPLSFASALAALLTMACSSPTGPGGHGRVIAIVPSPTRPLVAGAIDLGIVMVGSTGTATVEIQDLGDQPLAVSGATFSGPECGTGYSLTPAAGSVMPGHPVQATITFAPATTGAFPCRLTISSDATSGTSGISLNARAIDEPLFSMSGTTDAAFELPARVRYLRVSRSFTGEHAAIAMWSSPPGTQCGTTANSDCQVLLIQTLGTFAGTVSDEDDLVLTPGNTHITVFNPDGVAWTITEEPG